MDPLLLGLLSFVAIAVLIFIRIHVGTALIIVAIGGFIVTQGIDIALGSLQYIPYAIVANYHFAVVPLFILMGELVSASGLVSMLFEAAQAWLGRLKGGLGMAVVAMGAVLGAVTGSSLAAASMMTRVSFPEMLKHKYDAGVSAGLIAAVSPLVLIIPPSIFLAFYGLIVFESISQLLMAGLLPGLLAATIYMVLIYIRAMRNPQKFPTVERHFTWRERMSAAKGIAPVITMILIVLGGIYAGVFTASEGGAAGSIIAVIFVVALKRKKSGRVAFNAVWESAGMTSMVFYIIIGALLYGRFMAMTGATTQIIDSIATIQVSPYVTFAIIVVFYLILGCFLDALSMMAITLPITHPLIITLGFDPIWFGVVVVILAGAGTITPPFGIDVFAVKGLVGDQVDLWRIFMGALPFVLAMLGVVILMTIWPQIALFLPSIML